MKSAQMQQQLLQEGDWLEPHACQEAKKNPSPQGLSARVPLTPLRHQQQGCLKSKEGSVGGGDLWDFTSNSSKTSVRDFYIDSFKKQLLFQLCTLCMDFGGNQDLLRRLHLLDNTHGPT